MLSQIPKYRAELSWGRAWISNRMALTSAKCCESHYCVVGGGWRSDEVREIHLLIQQKGFRPKEIIVVTTLVDAKVYTKAKLAQLCAIAT